MKQIAQMFLDEDSPTIKVADNYYPKLLFEDYLPKVVKDVGQRNKVEQSLT